jgi:ABC-type antimicrobial peptide transport system permease subunit
MLKNALKIAWRNLLRDRQFSFLNLMGLATGLACSLLIYLWVSEEWSVDKYNKHDDRIYQVIKNSPNADGTIYTHESTPGLLAQSMAKELPDVEYAVAVRPEEVGIIGTAEKKIRANGQFAEKDFFKVFSLDIIEGNRLNPLGDKFSFLISDRLAEKLYGTKTGLIGRTLQWSYGGEFDGSYKITGVYQSTPLNSSDHFDFLLSYELFATKEAQDIAFWGSNGMYTYLMLKPGTDVERFNQKIKNFTREKVKRLYPNDDLLRWEGTIFVQRYSDKYLHNKYEDGKITGGRIEYVRLFSIIAIFILSIACINFMNLSTAKASRRMKEIGIKKVVGASRYSLILQYLGESMMMAFAALLIALFLVISLLPAFRSVTGKDIIFHSSTSLILTAIGITFLTGVFAGSYPAIYLSGFRPATVLKGIWKGSAGESRIRKALVVFQFSISIILILAVLVIYQQMKLIQTANIGYSRDNILSFSNSGSLHQKLSPFLADLKKIPGVVQFSTINGNFLGTASHGGSGISWAGKDPTLGIEYYGNDVDYDFFETMGLQMAEGRAFSRDFADSSSVIFNQSAIKAMGIKNPIGMPVKLWGEKRIIIGVVRDYNFQSMYKKISPAFLRFSPNNETTLVKIKAGTEKQTVSSIGGLFMKYNPGLEFDFKFLDDDYRLLYAAELRVAILSKYFAALAILISCLGLYGLTAFTAEKRKKEIGIRKVIGANVKQVTLLLSKDFLKLILLSMAVTFPISWWALNAWLQGFAYRVNMGWFMYLVAGSIILLIGAFTVSYQAIRAAIANPVQSLRAE